MCYTVEVAGATPIEGKDKIQVINFVENGYNVIASKNIKVGDIVMYFEVDSILPLSEKFEFLRTRCYKDYLGGFLIKNMKMFNIYSNGLVMTAAELGINPELMKNGGIDFTKTLNVRKFEPKDDASPVEEKSSNLKKFLFSHICTRWLANLIYKKRQKDEHTFPSHIISKSDETNIQNMKSNFEIWKNIPCYVSIKMEGQSCSLIYDSKKRGKDRSLIFGRNTLGSAQHEKFFKETGLQDTLNKFAEKMKYKSIAIQGEFCAPKVQGGIYKNGTHFYVYRVNINGEKTNYETMYDVCNTCGFEMVPVIAKFENGYGDENDLNTSHFNSIDRMQDYVEHVWFKIGSEPIEFVDDRNVKVDKSLYHRSEGIVVRALDNKTYSFKVKSNEYQLFK